jgi:hypothetical protein
MAVKVQLPDGMGASFSVDGVEYTANKKGVASVDEAHVEPLSPFGVVPVDESGSIDSKE